MSKSYKTIEHGKRHKKVVFLMGGWTYRLFMLQIPARILAAFGYHCIGYCYNIAVFSPDYVKTRRELLQIKEDVLKKIQKLKAQGKTDFCMFGTSLGSVLAVLVANESPDVTNVILNTTGSDMAEAVWSWEKFRPLFKQQLINQGMTLKKLKHEWKPISIIHNINNFKGKKVLIYLATKEIVIPYKLGEELVLALQAKGADCTVFINTRLKHSVAGMVNLARPKTYLDFLNTK